MHIGDYWRVYVPSDLGYGDSGSGTAVPGGSVLIFDLILVDYSPLGTVMKPWW
jgi:FKBP-type peptidyl-prolyl cis-trans isomerase FklB